MPLFLLDLILKNVNHLSSQSLIYETRYIQKDLAFIIAPPLSIGYQFLKLVFGVLTLVQKQRTDLISNQRVKRRKLTL